MKPSSGAQQDTAAIIGDASDETVAPAAGTEPTSAEQDTAPAVGETADKSAAPAETSKSLEERIAEAGAKATRDEVARIKAIIESRAGADRPKLALHLACQTDCSVDAAIAILEAARPETPPRQSFLDGRVPSPRLGAWCPDAPTGGDWDRVVEIVNAETRKNSGRA